MSKFKAGDKVYLDKRGIFGSDRRDWTLSYINNLEEIVIKNTSYTILTINEDRVFLENHMFYYHQDHFKKYEQI